MGNFPRGMWKWGSATLVVLAMLYCSPAWGVEVPAEETPPAVKEEAPQRSLRKSRLSCHKFR